MAEVQTIAVIGAGRRWAEASRKWRPGAATARSWKICCPTPCAGRRAKSAASWTRRWSQASVSADAADAAFSRLEFAGSVEDAARQADLVIEAVPEELESKIEIFTLLDKICRPGTILASNISSLSITEISRVTYRARNCVGMRFRGTGGEREKTGDHSRPGDRRCHGCGRSGSWKTHGAKKSWYCRTPWARSERSATWHVIIDNVAVLRLQL